MQGLLCTVFLMRGISIASHRSLLSDGMFFMNALTKARKWCIMNQNITPNGRKSERFLCTIYILRVQQRKLTAKPLN